VQALARDRPPQEGVMLRGFSSEVEAVSGRPSPLPKSWAQRRTPHLARTTTPVVRL